MFDQRTTVGILEKTNNSSYIKRLHFTFGPKMCLVVVLGTPYAHITHIIRIKVSSTKKEKKKKKHFIEKSRKLRSKDVCLYEEVSLLTCIRI